MASEAAEKKKEKKAVTYDIWVTESIWDINILKLLKKNWRFEMR